MVLNNLFELSKISDAKKRRPLADDQWWLNLLSMRRIMANYRDQDYHTEVNDDQNDGKLSRVMSHMGLRDRSAAMKPRREEFAVLDETQEAQNEREFEDARSTDVSD